MYLDHNKKLSLLNNAGSNYTLYSVTFPMGVWNIQTGLVFYESSGNVTINTFTLIHTNKIKKQKRNN